MAFKKIIPRSRSSSGDIRVSFSGTKTIYANVCFSVNFLEKIDWGRNCRVFVYLDDENPKTWMIEKAMEDEKGTFKVCETKEGKSGLSKLQFKFSKCEVTGEDRKLKVVAYEVNGGKVIIRN